jgi:hypothetical protein
MLDLVFKKLLDGISICFEFNRPRNTYDPSGLNNHLNRTAHATRLCDLTAEHVHLTERVTYHAERRAEHCHGRPIRGLLRLSDYVGAAYGCVSQKKSPSS